MSALSGFICRHAYRYLMLLVLLLTGTLAQAHEASTAYLNLSKADSEETTGIIYNAEYELSLRDLALLIDIDPNRDQQVSWAEVKSQAPLIEQLITTKVKLDNAAKTCQVASFEPLAINTRGGFNYLYTNFKLNCEQPIDNLDYQILAGVDANHRLIMTQADAGTALQVLAVGQSPLGSEANAGLLSIATNFLKSGIHHLLIGWDHLLFLFVLLIPAVYMRKQKQLVAVSNPKAALLEVFWIATSFTLAHSITLSLAALQIVSIPAWLIESVIALSIAFAALNNVIPMLRVRAIYLAFLFGLIHGFGFANVLVDLPLATSERVLALLSFNVGIELGQLFFIILVFPLALLLRHTQFYKYVIFYVGSLISILVALWWFFERAF
ncbi:HupE/UreJ family protein [Psychrobacter alimentarius]|uniref:HupE/UreJ family protein n=1 Tax=Psychrobacter alimentarius TaxID=261164 RepID=UPI00191B0383|nr:HupE/UreJ family protein [Psychrobacter alimentarius]